MKRDAFTMSPDPVRYLSLFSGIEAATVAWEKLGWECVGVAEIDPFACAVLAHHYPTVPNLGDITKITEADIAALGPFQTMVFGSPCQDMSIAGKRKGLLNADGTITRSGLFFAAFNIFQWGRKHCGARFAVWENVPGSYSSNQGLDFASVVEFMAGLDDVDVPPNGWGTEGCALGDNGLLEWACLDAQWFGVAQRRRRVFAVLDTGEWAGRQPILLERESLRGNTAPRRETWQDTAAATLRSSDGGSDVDHAAGGHLQPVVLPGARSGGAELGIDRSPTLTCNHEAPIVAGTLTRSGKAAGSATQQDAEAGMLVPIAFDSRQECVRSTEVFGALGSSSPQAQAMAFTCKDYGADATFELAPTMRAMNHAGSHANAGGQLAVCFANAGHFGGMQSTDVSDPLRAKGGDTGGGGETLAVCVTGEVTHTLKAEGFDASEDGTGRGQPTIAAYGISNQPTPKFAYEVSPPLDAKTTGGGRMESVFTGWAVRRLTPVECSRLQGFPDQYLPTVIYRGKQPADGPMYKGFGNSMAVPVMEHIGSRIDQCMRASAGSSN